LLNLLLGILLYFIILSCERPPLLGFSDLAPPITIVKVDSSKDTKLPSSATCFNRLNLPLYSNSKILKEKLLMSITQGGQGFYINWLNFILILFKIKNDYSEI